MYGKKEILTVVYIGVGFILLALAICGATLLWNKHRKPGGYDERQMIHRGRGSTLGFDAVILLNFVVYLWEIFGELPISAGDLALGTIWVGGLICVTYFMVTDSWARLNEQKYWWISPSFILSGVMQIYSFVTLNDKLQYSVEHGMELLPSTGHFHNLMIGIMFIYYGILHLACRWWHNRE